MHFVGLIVLNIGYFVNQCIVINEEVLRFAGTSRSLFDTVQTRKISFFRRIMRHDSLHRDLIEGMIEGKRGRGRPRMQRSDNII